MCVFDARAKRRAPLPSPSGPSAESGRRSPPLHPLDTRNHGTTAPAGVSNIAQAPFHTALPALIAPSPIPPPRRLRELRCSRGCRFSPHLPVGPHRPPERTHKLRPLPSELHYARRRRRRSENARPTTTPVRDASTPPPPSPRRPATSARDLHGRCCSSRRRAWQSGCSSTPPPAQGADVRFDARAGAAPRFLAPPMPQERRNGGYSAPPRVDTAPTVFA